MRNPHGYLTIVEPGKETVERDSVTCNHCNVVFIVKPLSDPSDAGGFCRICMSLICGPCADKGACVTWEKQMEQAEDRFRFLRSAGLA